MSCVKISPSWSLFTRPIKPADPPNWAIAARVLAADPPELSKPGLTDL